MSETKDKNLLKLESALERLLSGKSLNVSPKKDGKISMNMVALEAGVGSGTPYYKKYETFISKAKKKIKTYNKNPIPISSIDGEIERKKTGVEKLEADLAKAERDSAKYKADSEQDAAELTLLRNKIGTYQHTIYTMNQDYQRLIDLFTEATDMSPDQYIESLKERTIPKSIK